MRHSLLLRAGGTFAFVLAPSVACATTAQPQVFAPGVISSSAGVDCATFTPDGRTVFFHQQPWAGGMIMVSHRSNGHWSTPHIAPFSGQWHDHDPVVSPDGSYVVFVSNRPSAAGGESVHGGQLWRVDRVGDGWSASVRLPDTVNFGSNVYAPAIAANGDLYFQSNNNPSHQFHIYRSAWHGGQYQKATRMGLMPAGMHELDPAIAPDGSFIVFDAGEADTQQPDHLYIAFRDGGHWGKPLDLGAAIDAYQPWGSHLGPDGATLYFSSSYTTRTHWPRTREQARRDLARTRAWDNGTSHIFSVSLVPWLRAHRAGGDRTTRKVDTTGAGK